MVTKEEIEEQGLTTDDVLDVEVERPRDEVEWLPEWDDHPEERPGENTRIEDETLIWERDGFEARLESYETTHWRSEVSIPSEIGQWYPREIDLQCRPDPEYGYVESVDLKDYEASKAVLILQENFQPTWEVNRWIDGLIQNAEESQQFQNEISEKLDVARNNEG